ncbi:hypothetical protein [Teichococcus wenyumeiae]|uniref:hypothetical protein n=1 Tax=Teichococcus wenyumeiae TaxID=2478470 RepID=UPI001313D819|nr:hypothetical protein [Pseudoroseomonas wenyumeiae]
MLFGNVWQAALDHAGILSRRRARDIGAGDGPSGALRALIETLEATPASAWPERWRGLGKASETCPTLALFPQDLLEGRIQPQDAVIVWDRRPRLHAPAAHVNIAVGYLPKGCFTGLPRDHGSRTRWRLWCSQWDGSHGATTPDWMRRAEETPEGLLAEWVARGAMDEAELALALTTLSARIAGFSRQRMLDMAEARRAGAPQVAR